MSWYSVPTSASNPWNKPTSEVYINEYTDYNAWQFYYQMQGVATVEAIAGICGNILYESYFNPQQGETSGGGGYGLIQWTPKTALTSVVPSGSDYTDGAVQTSVIYEEIDGNISGRFFPSVVHPEYSYSGSQFLALTDYQEATKAYFWERERGTWSDLRVTFAYHYMELFSGQPPTPPTPPVPPTPTRRHKMPIWMYLRY